jgi:glycosyltransferase involved in cell wall biosynthesis
MSALNSKGNLPFRLAILTSHPIQYQVPFFRKLAAQPQIELTVFFCSDWGLNTYHDEGFGQMVKWDVPLLGGYQFELLPNVNPKPNLTRFWGLINPAVVERLRRGNFAGVWVHGWARLTDWLAIVTAVAFGIPVLLRAETNLLTTLPPWKARLKRAILTQLFRRISAFLAIGRYNAEFYEAYEVPKEKIIHVPYAVDNEFFLSEAEQLLPRKIELKRKLSIPNHLPVILFSGKLTSLKRPMDLLEAFAELTKSTKAALVYVGEGPMRSELESRVRKYFLQHVYFTGFKNQGALPEFYSLADIFVLPSGFEPWGLVVNEAMCFGLPVIVSNHVGATGDLVREEVNGFAYPVGDVVSLAEKLRILIEDTELRGRMGQASRELITAWSYEEGIREILVCLDKLGGKH